MAIIRQISVFLIIEKLISILLLFSLDNLKQYILESLIKFYKNNNINLISKILFS
jgi:hypothetical protein